MRDTLGNQRSVREETCSDVHHSAHNRAIKDYFESLGRQEEREIRPHGGTFGRINSNITFKAFGPTSLTFLYVGKHLSDFERSAPRIRGGFHPECWMNKLTSFASNSVLFTFIAFDPRILFNSSGVSLQNSSHRSCLWCFLRACQREDGVNEAQLLEVGREREWYQQPGSQIHDRRIRMEKASCSSHLEI